MEDPEKNGDLHKERDKTVAPDINEKSSAEEIADSPSPNKPRFPESDLSRGIVGWDGQDDPANPQNFSPGKKWGLLWLMSAITFLSPLASSMFSPAVSYVGEELHVDDEMLLSFSVSIFLFGYVVSAYCKVLYQTLHCFLRIHLEIARDTPYTFQPYIQAWYMRTSLTCCFYFLCYTAIELSSIETCTDR